LNAAFTLHPAAEAELREIVRHTRKQWGEAQARIYAAKIHRRIQELANGQKPYKDMIPTVRIFDRSAVIPAKAGIYV
jgi:toxin ParE1/3/4